MSSKMYSFLDKLEELMEKGEVSEGCYLKLCNAMKEIPMTDSQEDYWRQNFEREERRRIIEEERSEYLMEMIRFYENQNQNIYHVYQRLYIQQVETTQELERLRVQAQDAETPKQKLLGFFRQMERLSNIPRHKKKPYTPQEIEEMTPGASRMLYNKIFQG